MSIKKERNDTTRSLMISLIQYLSYDSRAQYSKKGVSFRKVFEAYGLKPRKENIFSNFTRVHPPGCSEPTVRQVATDKIGSKCKTQTQCSPAGVTSFKNWFVRIYYLLKRILKND